MNKNPRDFFSFSHPSGLCPCTRSYFVCLKPKYSDYYSDTLRKRQFTKRQYRQCLFQGVTGGVPRRKMNPLPEILSVVLNI